MTREVKVLPRVALRLDEERTIRREADPLPVLVLQLKPADVASVPVVLRPHIELVHVRHRVSPDAEKTRRLTVRIVLSGSTSVIDDALKRRVENPAQPEPRQFRHGTERRDRVRDLAPRTGTEHPVLSMQESARLRAQHTPDDAHRPDALRIRAVFETLQLCLEFRKARVKAVFRVLSPVIVQERTHTTQIRPLLHNLPSIDLQRHQPSRLLIKHTFHISPLSHFLIPTFPCSHSPTFHLVPCNDKPLLRPLAPLLEREFEVEETLFPFGHFGRQPVQLAAFARLQQRQLQLAALHLDAVFKEFPASREAVRRREGVAVPQLIRAVRPLRDDEVAVDVRDFAKLRRLAAERIGDAVHAERTVVRLFVEIAAVAPSAVLEDRLIHPVPDAAAHQRIGRVKAVPELLKAAERIAHRMSILADEDRMVAVVMLLAAAEERTLRTRAVRPFAALAHIRPVGIHHRVDVRKRQVPLRRRRPRIARALVVNRTRRIELLHLGIRVLERLARAGLVAERPEHD